jgi:prepilin-type N-terminal cleavage/methylation domain-containing protein
MTTRNHQQGLSLIELLISIALGVTLMSASLQFIVSTRQTYELNDDISRVQENGRIALDILSRDLRLAGYRQPFNGDGKVPDFFLTECTKGSAAAVPVGDYSDPTPPSGSDPAPCMTEGGTTVSDRLSVQFDPPPDDGTERTCQGNLAPATSVITNVYTVDDIDGDGINSLYCQGYDSTAENWIDAGPMPLVDGIDNLQILYGVAGSAANRDSVTKYISADKLIPTDLPNLRSARIALLVSNGLAQGFAEPRSRSYRLLDSDLITINDAQSRRIYSTTVNFNNYGTP